MCLSPQQESPPRRSRPLDHIAAKVYIFPVRPQNFAKYVTGGVQKRKVFLAQFCQEVD